ncbi:hypothetical protein LC607_13415 [Nostoc sp. CHAB 5824]|nr:hypothetical protein [Nostoc sp. CHAB 5824]
MHHSLKIKILDLDHIESIVEQDITDVEAEQIVGGTLSVSGSQVIAKKTIEKTLSVSGYEVIAKKTIEGTLSVSGHEVDPLPDPPRPHWHELPINLLSKADLQLQSSV